MAGGAGASTPGRPSAWLRSVRAQAPALLGACEDPHAELLALVWGARFDRAHAHALLARWHDAPPAAWRAFSDAAERFDALSAARQQRLRGLILRQRGRWHDNRRHAQAHSSD